MLVKPLRTAGRRRTRDRARAQRTWQLPPELAPRVDESSSDFLMSSAKFLQIFLGRGEGNTPSPHSTSWQRDSFPLE